MAKTSLDKDKIKFLLLEGVHQSALNALEAAGYTNIVYHRKSLPEAELRQQLRSAHFVGIRSRTQLTAEVLAEAERLIGIGCFCIGTNQRSEEHTSELQTRGHLVCRLLLEKKKEGKTDHKSQ